MKTNSQNARFAVAALLLGLTVNVQGAITDLAPAPLITSPTASVLPNVFLMLDDSGSMGWDYMPDNANNFNYPTFGGASSQCNGVYYDQTITYPTPVDSTGTSYSDSSFTAAKTNGFNSGSSTVNLSTSFVPAGGGSAAPAYYYKYTGTKTSAQDKDYYSSPSSQFYNECLASGTSYTVLTVSSGSSTTVSSIVVSTKEILSGTTSGSSTSSTVASRIASNINNCTNSTTGNCTVAGYSASASGSTVIISAPSGTPGAPTVTRTGGMTISAPAFTASPFTKVVVSSTSGPGATDERVNFANWYSFYRTRLLMMKTATGLAFKPIGSTFRVGMATMNNNQGSDLIPLNTFDATQKAAWYGKLYAVTANNSTPLREALSTVGKMYANKLSGNTFNGVSFTDPIQYSCQQNFTLLTTDGFWNGNAGSQLDGSAIGNQDGNEVRPMYDGSLTSATVTTPYTTVQKREEVTSGATTTNTWSKTTTSIGGSCAVAGSTPSNTTTAYLIDSSTGTNVHIALGLSTTNPDTANPTNCYQLGSANAWVCRGQGSSNPVAGVSNSTVTDSNNVPWYLIQSGSTVSGGGCVNDEVIFNNSQYSKRRGVCPGVAGVSGNFVSITPYTQLETTSGLTTTNINNYTANQQTTQTITNGIPGTVSALTPSTLSYTFTNTESSTPTGTATTTTGAWTAGSTATTCVATASLPTAGTTTPAITATSATGGTTTTTVLSTSAATAGTAVTTTGSPTGGTSNTLADVAEYYYTTDLRTIALGNDISGANGNNVEPNNVPSSGLDSSNQQHMTTFTLGLGARGRMVFDPSYQTQTATSFLPADFYAVKQGSTASGTVCSWQGSGACTWPTPASDAIENIDDLWHTAVNGRGTYFSATNPSDLSTALSSALAGVSARTGAAAAATTSNAFVTQGDNFLFRSTFVSQEWTGELVRQELDVGTGAVLPAINWAAQTKLDNKASRNIWFFDSAAGSKLSQFAYANLTTTQKAYFDTPAINSLSQLCSGTSNCLNNWIANNNYAIGDEYRSGTTWYRVSTAYTSGATFGAAADTTKTTVITGAAGTNLVNFIRGDRTNEGAEAANSKYFRQRNHVLGDIVNSESIYVKGALSNFTDFGYSTYQTNKKTRQSMVYVGANDGMLHAFYATDANIDTATGLTVLTGGTAVVGGDEAWAFIPTPVMNKLFKLADKKYGTSPVHEYYVDGSPVSADVCVSSCGNSSADWRTIVVGGLNGGGMGYYALDVTNPAAPKALWEITNNNMGYTFGNPKVVKLKTGKWVVLLTSGYNNTAGDGKGHLYVVDVIDGTILKDINTNFGSSAAPSGLARIDAPVVNPGQDATAIAAYGGDLYGNVWRFDINEDIGLNTGYAEAQLLVTLKNSSGVVQPITSKPLITLIGASYVVNVGTGRYLGSSDLTDTSQQSFYAIKDPFTGGLTEATAIYGNPRSLSTFIQQVQSTTTCPSGTATNICSAGETIITSTSNAVDFTTDGGWYFDFQKAGERDNTDPAILQGTIVINSNHPNASSCSVGGDSYQYQLDYKTGGAVSTAPYGIVGKKLFNELATRPVIACLADGTCNSYSQGSGGGIPKQAGLWGNKVPGPVKRTSWREIADE